ncbi:MAG TPA: hypothetical protein VL051_12420, partial [Burkholderiaceae bacterium]|nr:hypothetical protein [Burkholderiaceae bacterium]
MISIVRQTFAQSKYIRDIFWQGSGNVLAQALGVLAMPILTRLYTPSDFGTLNLFAQVVAVLTIILTWRYEYLIVLPKDESHVRIMFRFLTTVGLIGTIFLTTVGYFYGEHVAKLLGDAQLAIWLS